MKISLNWLADYIDVAPLRADLKGVLSKLTLRGLEVESIEDLAKGFDKVIVAQIETRDRHPNADRLSVCKVNTGKEVLQIVCGAQNMKAGDKIVLSQIGAHLPNGLKIEKGKIRDVESFGMLCSETELGLADTSEGILILPSTAKVGEPVAAFLGRNDVVFTLNVTPNRGDALSHIGVARELAAILGQTIKLPNADLAPTEQSSAKSADKISVSLEAEDACLQYHARVIENVRVAPSPDWLQQRLMAIGLRPINNIVDITNYVLMEFGQPLHAFDFSQIKGGKIRVRKAVAGEQLPLLDATSVKLDATDLVIADAERAVALAGVMGGGNSEVTEKTTTILLEAAQFQPSTVRKTAKRHQKHSDSSHRFERQVDPRAVTLAMQRATKLFCEFAGGKALQGSVSAFSKTGKNLVDGALPTLSIEVSALNRFLGTSLSESEVIDALKQLGFTAKAAAGRLDVQVPSYRTDVALAEDLYEEVLRVWGYDRVEARVPRLNFIPETTNTVDLRTKHIERLKNAFVAQGFCEAVNFGFTNAAWNTRWAGRNFGGPNAIDPTKPVVLANPLNEDLSTMKSSLIGGLFENLLTAFRHQSRDARLFEVRPVYCQDATQETGVREEWRVAAIMTGRAFRHALAARDVECDFFDLKGVLESVFDTTGVRGVRYQAFDASAQDGRLHPAQSAQISIGRGPCGVIGRLHPQLEQEFKLRDAVYMLEFSLDRALEVVKTDRKFQAIAKFPKVDRDFSLLVPSSVNADKVIQSIQKSGKPLVESISIVDTYSGEKIPAGMHSLSVSFVLSDSAKTLEDVQVDASCQKILAALDKELGVKLRLQ